MSDVLADLLRPDFVHGQGDLFLRSLLSHLRRDEDRPPVMHHMACLLPDGATRSQVHVVREALTAKLRRIDILISMRVDKNPAPLAIAIENKTVFEGWTRSTPALCVSPPEQVQRTVPAPLPDTRWRTTRPREH